MRRRITIWVCILALVSGGAVASAQTRGGAENTRLGALEFEGGYVTEQTAAKLREELTATFYVDLAETPDGEWLDGLPSRTCQPVEQLRSLGTRRSCEMGPFS